MMPLTDGAVTKCHNHKIIKSGRKEFFLASAHVYLILVCVLGTFVVPMSLILIISVINFIGYTIGSIIFRRSGIIHLDLIFLAFLLIYSISVPISNAILLKNYDLIVMHEATQISLVGYLGFSLGLLSVAGRNWKIGYVHHIHEQNLSVLRNSGMIVFWLGVFSSVLAIAMTSGFSAYLSAGYAGRALLKREVGPIEIGLYVCVAGLFAVTAAILLSKKTARVSKYIVIASFIFFFFYVSFLGIRRPLFLLSLGILAGYSIIRHKPSLFSASLVLIPALLFFTTFAQYRQLISSEGVGDTISFVADNISWEWIDVSETELGAPFRTLYDYLSRYNGNFDYRFGFSYLKTFIYVLPGFITEGVRSLSVEYTNEFFSSEFISIGGNMGFFPITEAYLNFGVIGVAVIFAVFGVMLNKANRWFHSYGRSSVLAITLFMMLIPWCAFFMRLDMASFSKGFLYSQLIPFFMIIIVSKFLKNKI